MSVATARLFAAACPLLDGLVDARALEEFRADPAFAAGLEALGWGSAPDASDRLGYALYETFGRCVSPSLGLLLDESGGGGGAVARRLQDSLNKLGLPQAHDGGGPDHLSGPLRALAHLLVAESDARRDGVAREVERMRALQRGLLDDHLLPGLPRFTAAVLDVGAPVPSALVLRLRDEVIRVREALGAPASPRPGSPTAARRSRRASSCSAPWRTCPGRM